MDIKSLHEIFIKGDPFPHIVIDGICYAAELNKAITELENMPESIWYNNLDPTSNETIVQKKKMAINLPETIEHHAPTMAKIMRYLNSSPEFLGFLQELTGIKDLIPDPKNLGGGIHRVKNGGKLSIHSDFNFHPETGKHRRINALLYLNKDWTYNGDLELWKPDMSKCVKTISPIFNRLVVFNTTDDALHGHPEKLVCPENKSRLSLAMYYYTDTRPENEIHPPHMAKWYQRPNLGY